MIIAGKTVNTKATLFFTLFYLITFVTYWLKPFGAQNALLENILYVAAPTLAVMSSLYLVVRYGMLGKKSLLYFSLFTGLGFLLAGEALFVYFDYFLRQRPFPTVADAFYLLSYPFIFIAMLIEASFMRISLRNTNLRSGVMFLAIFIILAGVAGYFGVYSAYAPEEPLVNNAISIGYGLGDLFIIAGAMYLLFLSRNLRRNQESYFWTGIIAGFGSITAADILFAKFNDLYLEGNVVAKNVMDSFWILGYVTIAFFLLSFTLKLIANRNKT